MKGRSFQDASYDSYRFGFNGKENDTDFGNKQLIQDYGFRLYNPALGKFLSVDPLFREYTSLTPYQFASNSPIFGIDLDGLEFMPYLKIKDGWKKGGIVGVFAHGVYNLVASGANGVHGQISFAGDILAYSGKTLVGETTPIEDSKTLVLGIGQLSKDFYEKPLSEQADIVISMETFDLATGLIQGKFAKEVKDAATKSLRLASKLNPCGCFTEGTQVYTENGYKNIEEIKEGDLVWAYDEETGNLSLKSVTNTFIYERDTIYQIHIGEELIEATSDHPFFIGGNWLKVKELSIGDSVQLYSGEQLIIDKIDIIHGDYKVYNFTVDEYHTYYISESNVLVHNSGPCDHLRKINPKSLNFSQGYVTGQVDDYEKLMRNGKWDFNKSPLEVAEVNGKMVSLDNRRLLAAQKAGIKEIIIKIVKLEDARPDGGTYGSNLRKKLNSRPKHRKDLPRVNLPMEGTSTQPKIVSNKL